MDVAKTATANWELHSLTYTITTSAGSGGTISPSGSVIVDYGSSKVFSIIPDSGYHIVDVIVDTVLSEQWSPIVLICKCSHTVSAPSRLIQSHLLYCGYILSALPYRY